MRIKTNKLGILGMIYSSPLYVLVNISAAVFYYFLFRLLITSQNYGIFLVNAPQALVYALVLSSSVLLTISVYGIGSRFQSRGKAIFEDGASVATMLVGALISGCVSCKLPFIVPLLYAFGFDALSVSGVISWIGNNQNALLAAFVIINLAMIYYSTAKVAEGCRIAPRRRR